MATTTAKEVGRSVHPVVGLLLDALDMHADGLRFDARFEIAVERIRAIPEPELRGLIDELVSLAWFLDVRHRSPEAASRVMQLVESIARRLGALDIDVERPPQSRGPVLDPRLAPPKTGFTIKRRSVHHE